MGVYTDSDEYTSPISPARLFKALILDSSNLIPKLMPQAVTSIETIHGDGGPGSIKQINFIEGSPVKTIKNRIDELNIEDFSYKYTLLEVEGNTSGKIETVTYEVKFEPTAEGGSLNKMKSIFYTKGDAVISEEEIKINKEKAMAMYKIVEAYLLQNPDAYV